MRIKPVGSGRHPGGTVTAETGGAEGASAARSNLPWIIGKNRPYSAYSITCSNLLRLAITRAWADRPASSCSLGRMQNRGSPPPSCGRRSRSDHSGAKFWNLRGPGTSQQAACGYYPVRAPFPARAAPSSRPPRRGEAGPPAEPATPGLHQGTGASAAIVDVLLYIMCIIGA